MQIRSRGLFILNAIENSNWMDNYLFSYQSAAILSMFNARFNFILKCIEIVRSKMLSRKQNFDWGDRDRVCKQPLR